MLNSVEITKKTVKFIFTKKTVKFINSYQVLFFTKTNEEITIQCITTSRNLFSRINKD